MSPRTKEQFETMRQNRKALILEAALHVFAEEGYHSASISKIAKEAGVSKGLMYNYFDSKQSLLSSLLHSIIDKQNNFLKEVIQDGFDDQVLKKIINHTIETLREDPKHWKLYFLMAIQPEVFDIIMKDRSFEMSHYKTLFFQFFQKKYGDEAEKRMHYFSSVFSGVRMNFVLNPDSYPLEEMREILIEEFVNE